MKSISRNLLAVALTCAVSTHAWADESNAIADAVLEAKIGAVYSLNEQLNPFPIEIESSSGVVVLSGTVESEVERELAEELARSNDGVVSITNNLVVEDQVDHDESRSGFIRTVNNATTTAKIKSQLLWSEATHGLDIQVSTRDGMVMLDGDVGSEAEAAAAVAVARNTKGVRSVQNNLAVTDQPGTVERTKTALKNAAETTSETVKSTAATVSTAVKDAAATATEKAKSTASTVGTAVSDAAETTTDKVKSAASTVGTAVKDTWITTKVKSMLVVDKRFDDVDVSVDTDSGVVTLAGTIANEQRREQLLSAVSGIRGVTDVAAELSLE